MRTMNVTFVAVVDDEAPVRLALRRLLCLAGYSVVTCSSGEDFIDALANHRPDCALLDMRMPGMSGLEVQAHLQAKGIALPVVFITASDDPTLERKALQAGAVRVLNKPFSNLDLLAAVEHALRSTPCAKR